MKTRAWAHATSGLAGRSNVMRVARRSGGRRVLAELGVVGRREATRDGARRFRAALEEPGTTYIKLGELLASRPDLDVYIEELGRLVDEVPPAPFVDIERVIEEEIGTDAFVEIDPLPLATASIAQTHRALLRTGARRGGLAHRSHPRRAVS